MRVLAIGDIHGCSRALDTLLAAVAPARDDLLVTLGDYVDRGPDSRGVLDRLLALHRTGRLVALRGNHDLMMLDACKGPEEAMEWLWCGGQETLASYAPPGGAGPPADVPADHPEFVEKLRADVPADHWEFLEKICVDWFETETHFFVHANAYADLALAEQPGYMLFWEKLVDPAPHVSGKIMICGHTAQKNGRPLNRGHAVCLDTWVYGAGWLTCLDTQTGKIWQANQQGQQRTGSLEEDDSIL
jgi:serine/threonine protein phosphatase 1